MTIDLKRIFKNMPAGIKLYSPLFGVCTLERVDTEGNIMGTIYLMAQNSSRFLCIFATKLLYLKV